MAVASLAMASLAVASLAVASLLLLQYINTTALYPTPHITILQYSRPSMSN